MPFYVHRLYITLKAFTLNAFTKCSKRLKNRSFKANTHLEIPANRSDLFKWLSQRVSNQFPVIQDFFNFGNKSRKEEKTF